MHLGSTSIVFSLSRVLCRITNSRSLSCAASANPRCFTSHTSFAQTGHRFKQIETFGAHRRPLLSQFQGLPACQKLDPPFRSVSSMAIPPAVGASSDSSTDASGDVSVDITRENFARMIPMIQRALNQCEFYSFDCEMTGLILDTQREEFFDDMQER